MNFENYLMLDASSPLSVAAGTLGAGGRVWRAFAEEKTAALEGVFSATEQVGGNDESIGGFLFCEGPGSILGIRVAAASVRARLALDSARGVPARPVFAFRSLNLVAHLLTRAFPHERDFVVAAESRMNAWNILRVSGGVPEEDFEEIRTADADALAAEKIFLLPCRRALPSAFASAQACVPAELLRSDPAVFADVPALLRDCGGAPDAVNTSPLDSYARWTPERHRG